MGDITNLDNFIQLLSESGKTENMMLFKTKLLGQTAVDVTSLQANIDILGSLWFTAGVPSLGNIPSTPEQCTRTTPGALGQSNPSGSNNKYLFQVSTCMESQGTMILYDRLCHMGGLSANTTSTQNVNMTATTRYSGASSVGNRILLEIYSSIGTNANTFPEISYTNQDGVTGRLAHGVQLGQNFYGSVGTAFLLSLSSGDTGVRSIETFRMNAASSLQGNIGLSIIRPLSIHQMPHRQSTPAYRDFLTGLGGFIKIENDACLSVLAHNAVAGENAHLIMNLSFIEV